MKSLRAKLFLSVGAILLLVAILNNALAAIWIQKELVAGGGRINSYIENIQTRIRTFSSFLLTLRILEEAVELDRVSNLLSEGRFLGKESVWNEMGRIVSYHPQVAFIQVHSAEGKDLQVAPEDADLSSFGWAKTKEGALWVKDTKQALFAALPICFRGREVYLLFPKDSLQRLSLKVKDPLLAKGLFLALQTLPQVPVLSFTKVEVSPFSYSWKDPVSSLFQEFTQHEIRWVKKTELIEVLLDWQEKEEVSPVGALDVHGEFVNCLFAKDLIPQTPLVQDVQDKIGLAVPFLVARMDQGDLDMVKIFPYLQQKEKWMALGFSLSSMLKEAAALVSKPILVLGDHVAIGWKPDGTMFNPEQEDFPLHQIEEGALMLSWQGVSYFLHPIDLEVFTLYVLNPEEEVTAVTGFLEDLGEEIAWKVSLTLVVAAILSFIIALLCLSKISGKITKPIVALSKASQELGAGKYEGLILPQVDGRQDEVAILTHSFNGMVKALQDRDKIRGVLNKVVSKEISEEILAHNIELKGEEKIVSLLFSDIRNFTHLAEGIPPHQLIEILNSYMTRMCRIIDETHGVVDKFVGDEIMTLYGAPLPIDKHAIRAIDAALLMMQDLSSWNEERRQKNEPVFAIGVGIHTGLVYTGNMGAENRLNYTAIGANVNKASRICSVAKPMQILISEETLHFPEVSKIFITKPLDPVHLKGIDELVQLYEIVGKQ